MTRKKGRKKEKEECEKAGGIFVCWKHHHYILSVPPARQWRQGGRFSLNKEKQIKGDEWEEEKRQRTWSVDNPQHRNRSNLTMSNNANTKKTEEISKEGKPCCQGEAVASQARRTGWVL